MSIVQAMNINEQLSPITAESIAHLKADLRGKVILPSDFEYDARRTLWNGMIEKHPAFIVACTGAADVAAAVRFAYANDLLISVRGAGHNIAGRALTDDVMLIDLQNLRNVYVDPVKQEAIVSPGATLGDIDHETQAHGLALPVGINSTTGIAGLTLGGGFGWLSRKYGMTIDNLLSAEIVTSRGEILQCDEQRNPDLFWAIRGGGGNFGIVTAFRFKLHPVGPKLNAGPIVFDLQEAPAILKKYRDACASFPEEFAVWTVLRHAPPFPFLDKKHHGKIVLLMVCLYNGDLKHSEQWINEVRNFGKPLAEGVGPHSFCEFQAAFDPMLTPGARNYWKSHNFTSLPDDAITVAVEYAKKLPSMESEIFIAQMGGKVNTVDQNKTAYPHRDVEYIMNVHTRWQKAKEDDACIQWARDFYQAMAPYATGGVYINFVSAGDEDIGNAYGENASRLAKIKSKYDPDNRIRANV